MGQLNKNFWDFVDGRSVIRRIVLFVTLYMTWQAFAWAAEFAKTIQAGDGANGALVIAAVTAPISVLQGFVFKVYTEGRGT